MRQHALSLRMRLFLLIVAPLVLVSLVLGYWRYTVAQETADELFDRGLLSTALAISRDVAISGGDALSRTTRDLIEDAAGGELFYHVMGPGGIYVTGYAYPPRLTGEDVPGKPLYDLAPYRGEAVRALRITETTTAGNWTGPTTVTVWQRVDERRGLAQQLALRAALLIAVILGCLALLVWYGVHLGLRPLRELHDAIALRSPDDLRQIKRPLPVEVSAIVATLNRLFGQVEASIGARQAFISDAAHQLRNPAAAILSLAQTLSGTRDPQERERRTEDLIEAARNSARLTHQLLSFERLRHDNDVSYIEHFDLGEAAEESCMRLGKSALERGIDFEFERYPHPLPVTGDRLMVIEALANLIDNAISHGGAGLSRITVHTGRVENMAICGVRDDGRGLKPEDAERVFSRFGQLEPGSGSGLGLSIVQTVARHHGGDVRIQEVERGALITLAVPLEHSVTLPAPGASRSPD